MFLFFLFLSLTLFHAYKRHCHFKTFSLRGIPGPRPSYWTGNLHQIRDVGGNTTPMDKMIQWGKEYGNIYGYFAGTRPMLVVTDLDLVREILVKNFKNFKDRPHLVINAQPIPHTLVGLRGNRWKQVRSVLSPIFSTSKMRYMNPSINSCISTTLQILGEKAEQGVAVDVWPLFQGLTCDVISKCALAMEVDSQHNNAREPFLRSVRGFLAHAMNPLVKASLCFPAIAKVAEVVMKALHVSHQMTTIIMHSVTTAMEQRRKSSCSSAQDVLQFMLEAGAGGKLSDEEIVANAWVFILGGFETTASALTFSTYLIAKHSHVQDKLAQELRDAFKENETPTYDGVRALPYLDQVVSECLRLYPPVVTFVSRHTQQEERLGPYLIPPGMNVQVPLWQIHYDPKSWSNPEKFDPDRFSPSLNKLRHSMAFIPFGAGPRSCIGARFALLELKMTLVRILLKFRINLKDADLVPKLSVPTVTLVPGQEIPIMFTPRYTYN